MAAPLTQAQWDEYTELISPARGAIFVMLAAIGSKYPELDKIQTGDQSPEAGTQIEHVESEELSIEAMLLAMEQAATLIEGAVLSILTDVDMDDRPRQYFNEHLSEARRAIAATQEYLSSLKENLNSDAVGRQEGRSTT